LMSEEKLEPQIINTIVRRVLEYKQGHTEEAAMNEMKYYRDESYKAELDERQRIEKEHDEYICDSWLSCHSVADIAAELDVDEQDVSSRLVVIKVRFKTLGPPESLQIYNLWKFDNADEQYGTDYPGRMPGQVVENLLYYYTEPFDVVIDPMAGGGTTVDVCRAWGRRYLAYDLQPARPEIQQADAIQGWPHYQEGAAMIILDPPYWTQKQGEYSADEQNLANLSLDKFYEQMRQVLENSKMHLRDGGRLAIIISASQVEGKIYDHAVMFTHIVPEGLVLENRIIVPYTTQQCQAYHVEAAKEGKYMLKLYRDLLIYRSENVERG